MTLDIRPEDLTEEQLAMAEHIGFEAYAKLIEYCGGQAIYVPKGDSIVRSLRDERIRNDFNGYNYKFLCNKYNLSERTIRAITAEKNTEMKNTPLEGQISFFDKKE
jgi:Mor family transcriptional regulator